MKSEIESPEVIVGMGGWQLEPFNGPFYPAKRPKGFRPLEFFSRFFDLVEVNATYHSVALTAQHSYQWLDDVGSNPRFLFSVKLFKGFTHTMTANEQDVLAVHRMLRPLAEADKLGALVIQFPFSFSRTESRREYLASLATRFRDYTICVEVRHRSWLQPDFLPFLHDHGMQLVNVDLPDLPSMMPLTSDATSRLGYFRLMGRNAEMWNSGKQLEGYKAVSSRYDYRYTEQELAEVLSSLRSLQPTPAKTFAVFHNDPHANSLLNGFQLRRMLSPDRILVAPPQLRVFQPDLQAITVPPIDPDSLFSI